MPACQEPRLRTALTCAFAGSTGNESSAAIAKTIAEAHGGRILRHADEPRRNAARLLCRAAAIAHVRIRAAPGRAIPGGRRGPPDWEHLIARACRYFGGTPDYWFDALTMTRLKAQNKELHLRPPVEEFASSYFGYTPAQDSEGNNDLSLDFPESELPEFEP